MSLKYNKSISFIEFMLWKTCELWHRLWDWRSLWPYAQVYLLCPAVCQRKMEVRCVVQWDVETGRIYQFVRFGIRGTATLPTHCFHSSASLQTPPNNNNKNKIWDSYFCSNIIFHTERALIVLHWDESWRCPLLSSESYKIEMSFNFCLQTSNPLTNRSAQYKNYEENLNCGLQ